MDSTLVFRYFPDLSKRQKQQIEQLYQLYRDWNDKINVISRKDIDALYERHVLHSFAIAKFIQFKSGSKVLDVGTGGGFPGIPLAIQFPEVNFHLVDSIGKKINVVKEIAKELRLENLTAEHIRAEKVKGKFDFIVSRAVAQSKVLYQWSHQKIRSDHTHVIENGLILLKGGDLDAELAELKRPYSQRDLSEYYSESFFETKKLIYIPING